MYKKALIMALAICSLVAQAEVDIASTVRQLWQDGNYSEAQALLSTKVNSKTKDAQLLALLGETEAQLNNEDKAEELLAKAIKLDKTNADYQHWYATVSCNIARSASVFTALGYVKRCKKAFAMALELAPNNPRSYIALGRFYAQAPSIAGGDKDQALQLAERLKIIEPLEGGLLELVASNLNDDAVFNALLAKNPLLLERPETYLQRGAAFAREEQHDKAIALYKQALTMPVVDNNAEQTKAQALYQIGRSAVNGKIEYEQGIVSLQQFIEQQPMADNIEWAKLRLGQLYILQQQQDKADRILKPLMAATQDKKLQDELQKLL